MATTTDSNTTINVNPGAPNVPEPPEFRMPTRPVAVPGEEPPVAAAPAPIEPEPTGPRETEIPTFESLRRRRTDAGPASSPTTRTIEDGPRVDTYTRSPAPTGSSVSAGGMGNVNGQKVSITETPAKTDTHIHHRPNWGGIVKGALIVTAVALAAVVAVAVVPPLVTGAINALGLGPMLSSIYATVGPILATAGDIMLSGCLFVGHFIAALAGTIGTALGIGGAAAGATAASTAAASAAAVGTGNVVGYVAAGGAIAAGAPLAVKALMTQPMVDAVHHTVVTPAHTTITGLEDGGASVNNAMPTPDHTTTTTTVTHNTGGHHYDHAQTVANNSSVADLPDVPDDLLHQQAANMKTASKMTHHAAEEAHENHEGHHESHGDAGGHDRRARAALTNSARASSDWASRVTNGLTNRDRVLLERHENYLDQVSADRAALANSADRA